MPVLPRLAAQPPPSAGRRTASHPHCLLSPAPRDASCWKSIAKLSGLRSPWALFSAEPAAAGDGRIPEEGDPLLLSALRSAWVRDQESRRPDPLFIDPYAAALLPLGAVPQEVTLPYANHYRLATRFVDDKLQDLVSSSDDLRQIVLLADGMDTRAYRLSWPRLSIIHDVSPGRVFKAAAQQLRGVGAKVSQNCVLLHAPLESPDLQDVLCKNGFDGNRRSLWVLQGLPLLSPTSLENVLLVISNLAMKGSIFMGELPHFPGWTTLLDMVSKQDRLENLFLTQGFRVSFVHYENVASAICLDLAPPLEQYDRILFVAEQLRFSDAQMETFRMHFERLEEDGDEEGFEEL